MENIKKFMEKDQFAKHNGIELLKVSDGAATAKFQIQKEHLNGVGVVHGGAIFALADFVFAAASNSHGTIALAINVSISYLKAVTKGFLVAEAMELSVNPKLATYSVRITDDRGDLVAVFQGMVYRKKDPIG